MSADFWAGYLSGAVGIIIGNPLDLIKTRIQAGEHPHPPSNLPSHPSATTAHFDRLTSLARGAAAPILGYGALNALLFVTYNRSLALLAPDNQDPSAASIWTAGALGGLASFVVSAPTELVKCRAQVARPPRSSWAVARDVWSREGLRGWYRGGAVTGVRDAVGYGFYFWSYELSKRYMLAYTSESSAAAGQEMTQTQEALAVLLCGGLAGVATWVSIFPLDVIKTRLQTWDLHHAPTSESQPLLSEQRPSRPSALSIARSAYRNEGAAVFFRGIGICSARAFVVNAVQWAVYEWMMKTLTMGQEVPIIV